MLARTKSSLLDLSFNFDSEGDNDDIVEKLTRMQNMLMFRSHRIRTLSITADVDVDENFRLPRSPKLETLFLDWTESTNPLSMYIPALQPPFPSVTTLTLHNVGLDNRVSADDGSGVEILRFFPTVRILSFMHLDAMDSDIDPKLSALGFMLQYCPRLEDLRFPLLGRSQYVNDVQTPVGALDHPLRRLVLSCCGDQQDSVSRILWYFSVLRPRDIEVIHQTNILHPYRPWMRDAEICMFEDLQHPASLHIRGSLVSDHGNIFNCTALGRDAAGTRRFLRTEIPLICLTPMVRSLVETLVIDFNIWCRWPRPALSHLRTLKIWSRHPDFMRFASFVYAAACPVLHTVEVYCAMPHEPAYLSQEDVERFVQNHVPKASLPLAEFTISGMGVWPKHIIIDHSAFARQLVIHGVYRSVALGNAARSRLTECSSPYPDEFED